MRLASIDITYHQQFMFDESRAYFKQDMPEEFNIDLYVGETESGFEVVTKDPVSDDGEYHTLSNIRSRHKNYIIQFVIYKNGTQYDIENIGSVKDLTSLMFAADYGSGYYEKTDYGFRISSENYQKLIRSTTGDVGEALEFDRTWADCKMYMSAEYYVSEGKLCEADVRMVACEGSDVFSFSIHSDFHAFGETEVVFPTV